MIQSKFETHNRKDDDCFYCAKLSHIAKDCYKKIAHECKHKLRKHHGNYVKGDTSINDGVKSLKLFVSEAILSVETNDENAWFIDTGASTRSHVTKIGLVNIMRTQMEHTYTQEITNFIRFSVMV